MTGSQIHTMTRAGVLLMLYIRTTCQVNIGVLTQISQTRRLGSGHLAGRDKIPLSTAEKTIGRSQY